MKFEHDELDHDERRAWRRRAIAQRIAGVAVTAVVLVTSVSWLLTRPRLLPSPINAEERVERIKRSGVPLLIQPREASAEREPDMLYQQRLREYLEERRSTTAEK